MRESPLVVTCLDRLPLELAQIQVMIEAALVQQLLVSALLDDLATVNHDDIIRIANGAQAMRDDEAGAPLHEAQQ